MSKGIDFQHVAREQYCSSIGHKAIDQALKKRILINMGALQRNVFVLLPQHAMACFDSIHHVALTIGINK